MSVNINLKEVFPADNADDLAGKLNFNFNQLIALGVGQPGLKGDIGIDGPPGPKGPIGLTGKAGSQIWSADQTLTIDLGAGSPVDSIIGDYYVGTSGIYKKESNGTVWVVISNFDALFRAIALDTQPWITGINSGESSPPRIIVPLGNSTGIDRITVVGSDDYLTDNPNWKSVSESYPNVQGVIFNFDVATTKKIDVLAGSLNGYAVNVTPNRLGSDISSLNEAFPYTALLSLYSFFGDNGTIEAAQTGTQFDTAIGYRHQLELGSVDNIGEAIHTTDPTAQYVISPTYQNLRVRKYRIGAVDLPGKSSIMVDFNLNSADDTLTPALNSKFTWKINKKNSESVGDNSQISLQLSNKKIEGSTIKTTGILVDGLHLSFTDPYAVSYHIAAGFDSSAGLDKIVVRSDSGQSIKSVQFDKLKIEARTGAKIITVDSNGLSGDNYTDVGIFTGVSKEIKLGSSDDPAHIALKIKDNRLSSAIPFAASSVALPTHNSLDPNTLDEYQEGSFTPSVYFGTLPVPGASVLTNNTPTITEQTGIFVKIGKVVTFTIKFRIKDWTVTTTTGRMSGNPIFTDDYAINTTPINVGELSSVTNEWVNQQHAIGAESYQLKIRNIMDQWPDFSVSEKLHFDVSINPYIDPITRTGYGIRPFPMAYSWNGTASPSTSAWETLNPTSIYAKFSTYDNLITMPELTLHGNRQFSSGKTSSLESNVSIYDFLNYVHPDDPNLNNIEVIINGSYITNHMSAQVAHPIGVTTTTTIPPTTTTTTVGPTTTTTTDPLATTTTTTAGPTTTSTTAAPTTTTTTIPSGFGSEMTLNSDSPNDPSSSDWIDKTDPVGLGDFWQLGGNYETYTIIAAPHGSGFITNVQHVTRQYGYGGNIGIGSNDFGISNAGSRIFQLTFKYRSNDTVSVLKLRNETTPVVLTTVSSNPTVAQEITITINGNNTLFNGVGFAMAGKTGTGPTIWFEIDQVSCREIL